MTHNHVNLALSGGGSKGIAHAGVLHFLEQQKIKPTSIAGTSAGAIVAALYASGKSPLEILDFFKSIYLFHWKHLTLKKPGIIDSASFIHYFENVFQNKTLQDLTIKLYITATDLVSGELVVFPPNTKITDAILASSAVPGIFSPYEFQNRIFSDGGILNHFPVDLLPPSTNPVIGVYVSPIQKFQAKDLNSIKAVTTRAFDLLTGYSNVQKFSHCQWLIEPIELLNFSTFETNKQRMEQIFNVGYQVAAQSYRKDIFQKIKI